MLSRYLVNGQYAICSRYAMSFTALFSSNFQSRIKLDNLYLFYIDF